MQSGKEGKSRMTSRRNAIMGSGAALFCARLARPALGGAVLLPRGLPAHAQGDAAFAAAAARAGELDQLHALLVARDGETVFAEAFRGPPLDRPVNVKSVSKTLVAALTGAALDRGTIPGLDATIGELAPGLVPRGADPRAAALTIEDLVTMRAGLERTSGGNYGAWVSSRDWVADALGRPFVAEPGGRMLYSTGSFHILGAVLAEAADRSLLQLARAWIGDPLGIEIPAWTRDPQGYYLGGNEMALSPRAMLRFGEMYRRGGLWEGERVLSADWVARSLQPRTASPYSGLRYGYGWFLGSAQGVDYALARGYGGQVICIVPARALTVVITSDPTRPARSGGHFGDLLALIEDEIIPAA